MRKVFLFLVFLIIITQYLFSQVPQEITYQGRLKEYGEPVTGKRHIKIAVYDSESDGNEEYRETFLDANIQEGSFCLRFVPKGIDWREQDKWIETTVGTRVLSPRRKFTVQPYAIHAGSAEEITKLDGEIYFSIGKSTYMKVNTQGLQVNGTIEAENITIKGNPVESINNLASVAITGDYNDLENIPNVVYISTIPADNFLEEEVSNIKNAQLADGTEPWINVKAENITSGTINDDRLSSSVTKLEQTIDSHEISNVTADKIGTGTVDNTEFSYLDGVTDNVQSQINSAANPDYDSGWFSVTTEETYEKAHGMGAFPINVQIFWAESSNPEKVYPCSINGDVNSFWTTNHVYVRSSAILVPIVFGTTYIYEFGRCSIDDKIFTGGYLRILAWK